MMLLLKRKMTILEFNSRGLQYQVDDKSEPDCIPTEDILTSVLRHVDTENDTSILDIHYIDRRNLNKAKRTKVSFTGTLQECKQLNTSIQSHLSESGRPKKLLIFINPTSGLRKAKYIYRKHADPIFKLCGVETHVIETTHSKHVNEVLETCTLHNIDGVVAVGGDGTLNDVISGLFRRTQTESGKDYDDADEEVTAATIPVGVIPAGSGNVTAQYLHGTKCPTTAVAKILNGCTTKANIATIHTGKSLKGVSSLILGFGLFGEMMKDCEKFRRMGPSRIKIIPILSLMKRRPVDVEISYLAAPGQKVLAQRQFSCPCVDVNMRRAFKRTKSTSDVLQRHNNAQWKTYKSSVFAVDTHPIKMKPTNGRMVPSFGEDHLSVYVTEKCSLVEHIQQLTKVKQCQEDCYKAEFVKEIRCQRYRVRLLNTPMKIDKNGDNCLLEDHYINCDGEPIRINKPQFDVQLHRRVLTLFGKTD